MTPIAPAPQPPPEPALELPEPVAFPPPDAEAAPLLAESGQDRPALPVAAAEPGALTSVADDAAPVIEQPEPMPAMEAATAPVMAALPQPPEALPVPVQNDETALIAPGVSSETVVGIDVTPVAELAEPEPAAVSAVNRPALQAPDLSLPPDLTNLGRVEPN